jgi:hypothetical protein
MRTTREDNHDDLSHEKLVAYIENAESGDNFGFEVYNKLPLPLLKMTDNFEENHQKDFFLLGVIPTLSSLIFNTTFTYRNGKVYSPNWNSLVIAGPSSFKSIMAMARKLLIDVDENKGLFSIPGNISSAALLKFTSSTNGKGCVIETEIDTVTSAIDQNWGDHSVIYRNAFENETISKLRISDEKPMVVKNPKFSIALSGTPNQVHGLLKGYENGMFSRFFIYRYNSVNSWKDWNPNEKTLDFSELESEMASLGLRVYESQEEKEYKLTLSDYCYDLVNTAGQTFERIYGNDENFKATIFRGIVIAIKMTAALSFVRDLENSSPEDELIAHPEDLWASLAMVSVSIANAASYIFDEREEGIRPERKNFLEAMPKDHPFSTSLAIKIGLQKLSIEKRAVMDSLAFLVKKKLILKLKKGLYHIR